MQVERWVMHQLVAVAIAVGSVVGSGACNHVAGDEPASAADVAAFDENAKLQELSVPTIAPDDADTNFSGVAYWPESKTFLVVDNEPNAHDKGKMPDSEDAIVDQGDLYEYDANGKLLRHIDLAGFHDPEAIAYMGADPKVPGNSQFVIAEERIGEIVVVSLPRYVAQEGDTKQDTTPLTIDKAKLPAGCVVKPTPNPIDDGNKEPNDGLEGVGYDPAANVFYIGKEYGKNRGVYRVTREGKCEPVAIDGLYVGDKVAAEASLRHTPIRDLSDLQFARGSLYLLSHESSIVVQARVEPAETRDVHAAKEERSPLWKATIVGQFPPMGNEKLPHRQAEGLAISDDGTQMWIVGEPREWAHYRLREGGKREGSR